MKNRLYISLMFLVLFASVLLVNPVTGQHEEHGGDHCETSTAELMITGSNVNNAFKFDKTEYKVERNTCYKLMFMNAAAAEHDVSIDEDGTDFEAVHMHLESNTDNNNTGMKHMNIMTPDKDVTYKIYCSVIGHEDAGMKADLVVGAGSSKDDSPGFSWFIALVALSLPVILLRRKR